MPLVQCQWQRKARKQIGNEKDLRVLHGGRSQQLAERKRKAPDTSTNLQ